MIRTAEAKKYYWLKLKENFFGEKEIKKLRRMAGGDTYTIIYLKMLLLSLRADGRIYFDGVEDSFADELALQLDENPDDVKITLCYLKKLRLIQPSEHEFVFSKLPKNMIIFRRERTERDRNTPEYKMWRKSVFERDGYTCQVCGRKGVVLNAHHIKSWKSFAEYRYDADNGITLCESCHREFHKKHGRGE